MTNNPPSPGDPRFDPDRGERLSREERFEDSLAQTWGAEDAAVDRRLRSLIGPVTPLYAPPYGFERVVLRARRRRSRTTMMGLAAGFTAIAVAVGGIVVGTRMGAVTIQTAGCDGTAGRAAPVAQDPRHAAAGTGYSFPAGSGGVPVAAAAQAAVLTRDGAHGIGAAGSGIDSGREVMDRKYEWAIGGVLTAAALSAGIIAGCSSSGSDNGPSASATESSAPTPGTSPSVGQVQLPPNSASPAPTPSATALPLCVSTDLAPAVSVVAGSQGAGHELMNVQLTNNSGHTCTVYGFPGLQLQDRNSAGQATNVVRDFSVKPTKIIVKNGASVATTVRFDFDIPAADEPQSGNCEGPSVYLGIIPPEEKRQLSATITGGPVTVCQHGTLDVLPFVSGPNGANQ